MLTDIQTICLTVGIVALYAIWRFRGFHYEKTIKLGVEVKPKKTKGEENARDL